MVNEVSQHKSLPKILIVDDEQHIHKLLGRYLEKHGFKIESCLNSNTVVEEVAELKPDLVLMDLMMPALDGISATKRIRNLNLNSYLPIIVITARKELNDMVEALEAGADDYLTKPFELEELNARIRNMLRLKKIQDKLVRKSEELDEANHQINRLNHILVSTNKQLQKKIYDFHNLFEISYRVMGQLEFGQLANQALLNILGIITTQSVILLMANAEDNEVFEVIESKGFSEDALDNFTIYRHDKLIHYLEIIKKPFQIKDISREFQDIIPILKKLEVQVVAPLFSSDEIFGILCLGPNIKDEGYTEDNLETLAIMTNMLSVALHNSQMYNHIKTLSYTDGMTGLHNYRFFRLRLKEEIARTKRDNSPLSLIIMDVDHFKNYNDRLGHPAGDDVLRKLSGILRKSVRDNDIVARYGGEEFAIILPNTEEMGSFTLAERIRQKVEKSHFFKQNIQPEGKITISAGIATIPHDAVVVEDLIIAADRALYHAKHSGRNQVIEAKEILEST
jgi:diguanylate cyclase (GGDEF)-like protein